MKKTFICDVCGMEFSTKKLDEEKYTLKNGVEVEVLSFSCPKCDEKFIATVKDEESKKLRDELFAAQDEYKVRRRKDGENALRRLKSEIYYCRKSLTQHTKKLKKKYLKEVRKNGKK